MENLTPFVGILAGIGTTVAFIPQLVKVYQTKSAQDVSAALLIIFSLGVALWLIYGILRQDLPMIVFNTITFVLAIWILILKTLYHYRLRKNN